MSRDVSHETIKEHINHSLLLGALLERSGAERITDTGSGGGLPGIPLAICFPEKKFRLNDIVSKKMLAAKQMMISLGLDNVEIETGPISEVAIKKEEVVVTKHAFKLNQLISFLDDKKWGEILFLKGEKEVEQELEGIEEELNIEIINLDRFIKKEFYSGKAIVRVKRISDE